MVRVDERSLDYEYAAGPEEFPPGPAGSFFSVPLLLCPS
jgi:hypothetical protein